MRAQQVQEATAAKQQDLQGELSTGGWQSRKAVVSRLLETTSEPSVEQVLWMLRDEHRDLARANAAIEVLAHTASDVVPSLLDLLKHPDADLRCYVALTLGERGDPRTIPALVERLRDEDTNVRSHAIEALGKLRAASAVDSLVGFVEELNFELAFPALDALKMIGDCRIAHRLLSLLDHSLYKLAAIEAMGELGDEEVIRPLLDRFQDADIPPSTIAIALAKVHERHEEVYGACEFMPELVRGMTSRSGVQAFLSTVSSDVPDAGRLAAVLSWLPGEEIDWTLASLLERFPFDEKVLQAVSRRGSAIIPLLVSRLGGASADVRRAMIELLLRVADRKSTPTLLNIVKSDEDELSVARALEALSRLSEPRLYHASLHHFGHSSARVRQAAVAAFGCAACESAVSDLQTQFLSSSPLVRESALRAAAYLGEPACQNIVIAGCLDRDEQVRRTAIEQLAAIEDDRVAIIVAEAIRSENPHIRAAAVTAISKIEIDQAAAESLIRAALSDNDVWVRYFAIRSLVTLNLAEKHLHELIAMAKSDAAMQVRIAAIEALGSCGIRAYSILRELTESEPAELADAAMIALPRTGHPQALSDVTQWLTSTSEPKRRKAVHSLAGVQTLEAVEILQRVALGTDHRLALEAIASLGRIPLPSAATALVEALAWPGRRAAAIEALVALSGIAVAPSEQGLSHESVDVRRAAVEVLARIRSAPAIAALDKALLDAAATVRHAALTALAHTRPVKSAGTRVS